MKTSDKIYVAGHCGLVGSALMRQLKGRGYSRIVTRTHSELDLVDQLAVREFFAQENPDIVFLAAAKVGGIHANNTYRADFIYQNLMIQCNVIDTAFHAGVRKLLFLGSSCIYPRDARQPIDEGQLLAGPLETTNEPYAVAKLAGIKMCGAYNAQYGTDFIAVMPTNLYGCNDNYHLENSHMLPALIRKFHEAKLRGDRTMSLWGTGTPRRELLYSDDMAEACCMLMESHSAAETGEMINIGSGEDLTVAEIAGIVKATVGFQGDIQWDHSRPDGTPRKLLDVRRIRSFGWRPRMALNDGVAMAYQDFLRRQNERGA